MAHHIQIETTLVRQLKQDILIACFLLTACVSQNDMVPEGPHQCSEDEIVLAIDEASPDGETAADYLAFAEIDVDGAEATIVDHDDETLSFSIVRGANEAYFIESDCGNRLEIPLVVTISTDESDLLDEEFELRGRVSGDDLVISHSFELADLQGSFDPQVDDGEIYRVSLEMTVRPDSSGHGSIDVSVERHHGDSVSSSQEQHILWAWD